MLIGQLTSDLCCHTFRWTDSFYEDAN